MRVSTFIFSALLSTSVRSLARVVKCTVLLTNISGANDSYSEYLVEILIMIMILCIVDFPVVNAIYAEFFPSEPPARATFAVTALPANALVESNQ